MKLNIIICDGPYERSGSFGLAACTDGHCLRVRRIAAFNESASRQYSAQWRMRQFRQEKRQPTGSTSTRPFHQYFTGYLQTPGARHSVIARPPGYQRCANRNFIYNLHFHFVVLQVASLSPRCLPSVKILIKLLLHDTRHSATAIKTKKASAFRRFQKKAIELVLKTPYVRGRFHFGATNIGR